MFKLNLYIPLIIVTIIMSVFSVFMIVYVQEDVIHKNKESISKEFLHNLDKKVIIETSIIKEYISFIQSNKEIEKLFLTLDKKALNSSVIDIYKRLNKNVDLTHMYFIKTDGSVLLRVHDYGRDKDIVNRTTFKKAKESQSAFHGLEFGIKKNYTLRVVKPWIVDGKLIGDLELGKEIDKIINELSLSLNTEIYLAVKKEIYTNASKFAKQKLSKEVSTTKHYIVYHTSSIPTEMEEILNSSINNKDIEHQNHEYFVSKQILSDVSGKELGYFVFLSDITVEHAIMYNSIKVLSTILIVISMFLIIGGNLLIKNKEKNIFTLTSKLEEQKSNLALANNKLQKLFNLQQNIIIITDGADIVMANKAMFEFFGFEDLNDFFKHYSCICDRFVVHDNYFNLEKVDNRDNWIETVKELPDEQRIVALLDTELISHAFSVAVSEFEEQKYIISFTDISNTMIEQQSLRRKATHDKLTGVYNREFFENNINIIVQEAKPKKLGVILCDIDHFKVVNDTFGHNRGDTVLKEFTTIIKSTIRDDDYLIRWGGEEFILLTRVNNIESLKKVAEKIRINIEQHPFEEVNKITSSFGVTLHVYNEDIIKTIERADKALYTAKESGRNQYRVL